MARADAGRRSAAGLLLEIGTEELPPKALARLGERLAVALVAALEEQDLLAQAQTEPRWFATPRRLAVRVPAVRRRQRDRDVERRGPPLARAFDDSGAPTAAALGFARSCGVEVSALDRRETPDGAWLVHRARERGRPAAELIPAAVERAVAALPIPRRMRWGAGAAEFVRPVHWIVLLHGTRVVPAELFGIPAGRRSRGHRFHHSRPISIPDPDAYEALLAERGTVLADFAERRGRIEAALRECARTAGGEVVIADELLDEVTALVEWPTAVAGGFETDFLALPPEVLVSSMRDHQKYFHLLDAAGRLLPAFITVSNLRVADTARIRAGNERVLRARLADARFFWDTDGRGPLEARIERLAGVLFHRRLGSVGDKAVRIAHLARRLAPSFAADGEQAARAATLCKADLVTAMVGEFPELQGTMGRYYAEKDGEAPAVCAAIDEHYRPRFAADTLPRERLGVVLALADRLDTLAGLFAAGEEPSGEKDPYGLRRAALAVVRILIEGEHDVDVPSLLREALERIAQQVEGIVIEDPASLAGRIYQFMLDRLRGYYQSRGFAPDELAAVLELQPGRPLDIDRRLRALAAFRRLPEAEALSAANRRIRNILRQAGDPVPVTVDPALFEDAAERALSEAIEQARATVEPLTEQGDHGAALARLAALREPVDRFFDDVLVMVDDPARRANRLALLNRLGSLFLRSADLSRLQGQGT